MPLMDKKSLYRYAGEQFYRKVLPLYVHRVVHDADERPHDHDFLEIAVVAGGTATHVTARGSRTITAGFAVVLRPGAWHAYTDIRRLDAYDVLIGMDLLRRELAWMLDDPAINHLLWSGPLGLERDGIVTIQLPPPGLATCTRLLDDLRRALQAQSGEAPHRRSNVIARLVLLLDELAAHLGPAHRAAAERTRPVPGPVLNAIGLLEQDLTHAWTSGDLARRVRLSDAYFIRLFKRATGLPPLSYLARMRAERAAGFLLRTDLPLSLIGEKVGWPDPCYFARRFRQHYGMSGTAYRLRFVRPGSVGQGA